MAKEIINVKTPVKVGLSKRKSIFFGSIKNKTPIVGSKILTGCQNLISSEITSSL
jgi:hypothetical protein